MTEVFRSVSSAPSYHVSQPRADSRRHAGDATTEISRYGAQPTLRGVACERQRQGKMATQGNEATNATVSNGEVK